MNCPEKCHQERIFSERHGKAKAAILVSGGVGFRWTCPCSRCGKSEALSNYKPCARGGLPGAEERGLSTPQTTWIHTHTCAYTDMLCEPNGKGKVGFWAKSESLNT